MGTQRGGRKEILGTGRRWRAPLLPLRAVLPVMLGTAALLGFTAASSAGGPTIEAAGGAYGGYSWAPAGAEVAPGGTVAFKNASAVLHGLSWTSGPETPTCTGVPINEGKTNWSGSCSFAQAGTYRFYCPVHPTEMTGTITVSTGGTVNPPPPAESPESPLVGPASKVLKLARNQRGGFVRGSIDISQAGVGARLQIGLIAKRAALLGTARAGTVRVGRLIRPSLQAGRIPFAVPLKRLARRALRLRGRLSLMVKLVVTPTHGEALKLSRGVVVHG